MIHVLSSVRDKLRGGRILGKTDTLNSAKYTSIRRFATFGPSPLLVRRSWLKKLTLKHRKGNEIIQSRHVKSHQQLKGHFFYYRKVI